MQRAQFVKTEEQNTQANECPNDALLTKIMDNEASRAYIENMPETKNGIYHKWLFENVE